MHTLREFHQDRRSQGGSAFMVVLTFLVMGLVAFLVNALHSTAPHIARDSITSDALAQARTALIGRAISDATSPGSLPCPDSHAPGSALQGTADLFSGNHCPHYLGRLPWKTLGLPDLRDGAGERLWYALSPNFRDFVTVNPINSNSTGTLLAYDDTGAGLLTPPGSEGIAILFAPGSVVATQQRDFANQNLAQNYLDSGPSGYNNAVASGPFTAANTSNTFNDRLMILRADDLFPLVEARVAKELATALISYQAGNLNQYPHPANFAACTSASCVADPAVCSGKIPATDPGLGPLLPTWFAQNNWHDVIYFSVGTNSLTSGGAGNGSAGWARSGNAFGALGTTATNPGSASAGPGTGCAATVLHVSSTGVPALFLLPGAPLEGIARTSLAGTSNISQFFEEGENQNLDDLYTLPTTVSNDMIFTLP